MLPTPKAKRKVNIGRRLRDLLGFDLAYYTRCGGDDFPGYWRVKCSQCEAIVINGIPCHELGCPNLPRCDK